MNKIIKRLEIIKSAIELEDEEIIRQQLIYLKNEPQDAV
ncbi:molecular chaperone DnaJ, partial [Salmonella enterica subsp. enterica serovar Anatum]|nr:molecular chaperone DnaJ [Salmonella enterica subsp. enterica serovar Anatum]MEA1397213.1 molecular chaperone DnaJ [Salmonella enterica]